MSQNPNLPIIVYIVYFLTLLHTKYLLTASFYIFKLCCIFQTLINSGVTPLFKYLRCAINWNKRLGKHGKTRFNILRNVSTMMSKNLISKLNIWSSYVAKNELICICYLIKKLGKMI